MMQAAVYERIRRLPRRDRWVALRLIREKPIRLLGGCLECGEASHGARVGIYVPQEGSPVQQVVVYSFCAAHADAGGRLAGMEIEQLVLLAPSARPHVKVLDVTGEARRAVKG